MIFHPNLEYGSSLKSSSGSYSDLSMNEHQNLECDCFKDDRGTVIIILEISEKLQ